MEYFFSIIIPTRHRPEFIKESLKHIKTQSYKNYEVIVCDNYTDVSLSCENYCKKSGIKKMKYVKPTKPVGMVENWNLALNYATGDYILYLTDKMFLLPHTLKNLNAIAVKTKAEIINWVDDIYTPKDFADYFGKGYYSKNESGANDTQFVFFNPIEELSKKGDAELSRQEQSKSSYVRGKICFGAFKKELVQRLVNKYSRIFYNITPDYTSMILALVEAKSGVEIGRAGIVHLNTDISNGRLASASDVHANNYLRDLADYSSILETMLIKGLYSSVNNMVARDYLYIKEKSGSSFRFNKLNWLMYIKEDIFSEQKIWSSEAVKNNQIGLYNDYVESLPLAEKEILNKSTAIRQAQHDFQKQQIEDAAKKQASYYKELERIVKEKYELKKKTLLGKVKEIIKNFIPSIILKILMKYLDQIKNPKLYAKPYDLTMDKAIKKNSLILKKSMNVRNSRNPLT